jgi:class I lanthipeptide synthase
MTTKKKWHALMNEEEAKPYKKKLAEIAEVLLEYAPTMEKDTIGVMGGKVGVALFFFYYAQYTMEERFVDAGIELLSESFDAINDGFSYHTLAGGLAGVGWTVEHLVKKEFLEMDTNETLEDLDPYLHKTMIYDIQNKNYDFLHGAVGNGTYFLERLANPKAKDFLSELVDELEKVAHTDDDGSYKWISVLNREDGTEGYNLSLSHGLSAIIAFLGKVLESGINKEKTEKLLNGAVQFMLKHRLTDHESKANFPSWVPLEGSLGGSRMAWCYGDLGMSIAFWHTAQSLGNKEWAKICHEILLDSTKRKDIKQAGVLDAGLCHGAAGIMHIYARAYQYSGDETFKETAKYWADQTLKFANHEDGAAGYKAWHTEEYGGWVPEKGLLEGVAGIGLGLISLISDIDPGWDRTLFIS